MLYSFQNALDPGSLFNIAQLNSKAFLDIFNFLSLDTISARMRPLRKFLLDEMEQTKSDSEGYFTERFLAEKQKNDELGNYEETFFGKRGEVHILGTLMDLFIAGM